MEVSEGGIRATHFPTTGDFVATSKRSTLDNADRPVFPSAMMSAARHHRTFLRFATMALCLVFAAASAPAWLVEGLCEEICCTREVVSPASASSFCCATTPPETTDSHEHRPAPCPLSWCCGSGEFTTLLQSPSSLREGADNRGVDVASALLTLDAALEEQQARRFVAEPSPPKPSPVPMWLSNASLLI